ncbi:MAG: prepilin-type N-terminal cleavage/methylation domain-containing protein [Candidatus Omnitrophica bacterium]|nr:prepilin-type N-terminal cleavage/methylation domain-containing protein [Candidatus Omnitrophota bacterium]
MMMKKRHCKGMTLVEILITVGLFAAVSLAIYRSLDGGIRVWKKSQELVCEEGIALFFERLTADIRNAREYSLIMPEGGETKFAFSTTVVTAQDQILASRENIRQIGKVEYYFDITAHTIYRRQANYGQAVNKKFQDPMSIVNGLDSLHFKYFYLSEGKETQTQQVSSVLPYALEAEVKFTDRYGPRSLKKLILIPVKM